MTDLQWILTLSIGGGILHIILMGLCSGLPERMDWFRYGETSKFFWALFSFLIPEVLLLISLGYILSQWSPKRKSKLPRASIYDGD